MMLRFAAVLGTFFVFLIQHRSAAKSENFHFVLVHGAGHGAWCWYKVTDILQQRGHRVDTLDLVSAGKDAADPATVGGVENYTVPLIQLLESLNDTVILVAHSLGGISLTYAMEKIPNKISRAVYVAAFMFNNNATRAREIFNRPGVPGALRLITPKGSASPTAAAFNLELAQQVLYGKSPSQDVILAKSLLKPFPLFDPAVNITSANYGRIPRYYIKTRQDQTIPLSSQEQMIQDNLPVKVFELDTDHSAFFSKPQTLVDFLLLVAV